MHDYHAMTDVIERLLGTPGEPPTEVRIRAGPPFTGEALTQAYEMLTTGTRLQGSRLVVEPSVEEAICPSCDTRWTVAGYDRIGSVCFCPSCGAPGPAPGMSAVELLGVS